MGTTTKTTISRSEFVSHLLHSGGEFTCDGDPDHKVFIELRFAVDENNELYCSVCCDAIIEKPHDWFPKDFVIIDRRATYKHVVISKVIKLDTPSSDSGVASQIGKEIG